MDMTAAQLMGDLDELETVSSRLRERIRSDFDSSGTNESFFNDELSGAQADQVDDPIVGRYQTARVNAIFSQ